MSSRRPYRSLPLAAIAGLALLVTGVAQAQPGSGGGGRGGGWMMGGGFGGGRSAFTPEFTRADMTTLVDVLRLDDTQVSIAEALLLDYESAFLEALDDTQAGFQSDEGLDASMRERQEKRRAMRDQFRVIGEKLRAQRQQEGEIDEKSMEAYRAKFEAMRDEMAALRPTEAEMDVLRERFRTLGAEWRRERLALRALFVANMQAILTEGQLPDWDRFERQVRRRHSIERGMLSAESVDLLLLLNEMGVGETERRAFSDVLESYEVELDSALVARNAYLDEGREAMFDAMRNGDTDTVRRELREESKLRIAVRDVNESYAVLLTELLRDRRMAPGEAGFQERYLERAFPRIYRPTVVERSFDAVRRFEDIPQEFMDPILNLEEAYLAELDTINGRLLAATRQHEAEQMLGRFERRMSRARGSDAGGNQGDTAPDPIGDIRDEREELDQRYRRQLESVLTEDQIDALPSMREGGRRFDGGGRGDFGNGRGNGPGGGRGRGG